MIDTLLTVRLKKEIKPNEELKGIGSIIINEKTGESIIYGIIYVWDTPSKHSVRYADLEIH